MSPTLFPSIPLNEAKALLKKNPAKDKMSLVEWIERDYQRWRIEKQKLRASYEMPEVTYKDEVQ